LLQSNDISQKNPEKNGQNHRTDLLDKISVKTSPKQVGFEDFARYASVRFFHRVKRPSYYTHGIVSLLVARHFTVIRRFRYCFLCK